MTGGEKTVPQSSGELFKWPIVTAEDESAVTEVLRAGIMSGTGITREFEKEYGSISHMKNLVHFLLKYRWKINWDRELHENYFCTTIDEFLKHMNLYFNINYLERFRVPFLEQCWKEDFGIELDDYTHVKMILEKKKNEKDERGDDKES